MEECQGSVVILTVFLTIIGGLAIYIFTCWLRSSIAKSQKLNILIDYFDIRKDKLGFAYHIFNKPDSNEEVLRDIRRLTNDLDSLTQVVWHHKAVADSQKIKKKIN